MTIKRSDSHSTEFGLWLRDQPEIDSKLGYLATNIDYVWRNWRTGEWMFIEEKRYKSPIKTWQKKTFFAVHRAIRDLKYKGFWCLFFENTNPEDGKMWLGRLGENVFEITKQELLDFLRFKDRQHAKGDEDE